MAASFPGAVKTFATRSNGQTIDASHIDDLQDEVTAIESGYLNGTAPINASNAVLRNLSVTGGSTLGALSLPNLTVSGGSTFAAVTVTTFTAGASTFASISAGPSTVTSQQVSGDSTIVGDLFVTKPPPHARVNQTSTVSTPNNTEVCLNFNNQRANYPTTIHSTTTNSSRLTAPSSGIYAISGHVNWGDFSTSGVRTVRIYLNDSSMIATQSTPIGSTGTSQLLQSVMTLYPLASGDWVTLRVQQTGGSTGSLIVQGNGSQEFALAKIR